MSTREQKNFEFFKILLQETIDKEEAKLKKLNNAKDLVADKELTTYVLKRENFLSFCKGSLVNVQVIDNYLDNAKYIDNIQKEFYLNQDFLKKEALKLMSKNQKLWFGKLFQNNFEILKSLMRSLLISETTHDTTTLERVIQEIELLRYKEGF